MKKIYTQPEIELTELLTEDILSDSLENGDTGLLDDEVTVDIGNLFDK